MPTPRKAESRLRGTHSHGLYFSTWTQSCPKLDPAPDFSVTQTNRFSILPKPIWVGFLSLAIAKNWLILGLHPDQSLWHTRYSREETGTRWEEKDIERTKGRGNLDLPLYIPRRPRGCPGYRDSDLSDGWYLYPKVLCCDAVPWAGSLPVAVKQFLQETVLKLFPNPQSWVTRGILLDIFIL